MPELVCVGNITIDESVQPDGSRTVAPGGDAIFAALAARLTGCPARMLAPVGNDLPPMLAAQLERAGLSLSGLPRRDLPTVRNTITYHTDGTRVWDMRCAEEDFDRLSIHPVDVDEVTLAADGVLVLAMSLASQLALIPWLRAHSDACIYLDVQEDYIAGHEDEILAMVERCDVFLPSEIEATRLTGATDPADAAVRLAALGPECVVVTLAERGALVHEGGVTTHVAAEATLAVDATGAGDAFCGGFAAAHLTTGDVRAAAKAGAAAARVAVSGHGVRALLAEVGR